MFMRKLTFFLVFTVALPLAINQPALADICLLSTQVSETYSAGDTKTFRYEVTNLNIKRLDLFIELTGAVTPTFTVAIDNNISDGSEPAGFAISAPGEQFYAVPAASPDHAQLTRLGATGNQYLLSIEFFSTYSSTLCGPKCEAGSLGCVDPLPAASLRDRRVIVTIGGLSAAGHLQVNGVSKTCNAAPAAGLPNESLVVSSPAKAFIDSGVDPCPAGKPTDVALVLDHSGSMTYPAGPGGPTPTRSTVLNQSMDTFFDIWKQAGQFNQSDAAGAVFFESPAIIRNFPAGTFLVTFGALPSSNGNLNNLIAAAANHTQLAGPATAMGQALQAVYTGCAAFGDTSCSPQAGFASNDHYRQIVLFTDGEQFGGPDVIAPASPDAALTLSGIELRAHAVPVHTIGTGFVTGTPYNILLQRLSLDTGGRHTFTEAPLADMAGAFLNTLIDIFRNNTLGLVDYQTATINNGGGPVQRQFLINRSAKRVVFLVSWHAANPADQNPNALTMEVLRPGSTPVTVGVDTDTGSHHIKNITIPLPDGPAAHEGLWTVRVNENLTGPSQAFNVAALVDEVRMEYNLGVLGGHYSTGGPVILQASVYEDGVALKNLSSVRARVTRPKTALGSLLHERQVSPADLTGPTSDALPNAYSKKIFKLIADPVIRALLTPVTDAQPLILLDNGTNGDPVAGDGIYTAVLPGTSTRVPGQYVFEMTASGTTAALGNFSRTEKSSALVRVLNPDQDKSEVAIDPVPLNPGEFQMVIVPADAFGNFLGPGFDKDIEVTVNPPAGITISAITDPRQDGSYNLKLSGVPSGSPAIVTVKALNKVIFSGQIERTKPKQRFAIFGGVGGNFPQGDFNTFFDPGLSTQLGFEYRFTNRISAEGTFGYDRFQSAFVAQHISLTRASGNLKAYPVIGTFQFGIFGGGGVYHFNNGGGTHGGLNIGAVSEFRINTTVSLEATYNFHNVFTSGSSTRFSTVQGGVRFRF